MSTELSGYARPSPPLGRPAALSAYLPHDRRLALAQGQTLPDRTTGTALFADISGFSALTEALTSALGPHRGAEELSKELDTVYEALISQVERYGGSIIGFAGDSITCWFDDAGVAEGGPWRAAACGLALQKVMESFQSLALPRGLSVSLAIKVALATGPARRLVVGDPQIQLLDVLAGTTVARMATGEQLAQQGQVLADAATVDALGPAARMGPWRTDTATQSRFAPLQALATAVAPSPWTEVQLDAETSQPWILPAAYEREISGQGSFFTEFRLAVTLFLRFVGIDYECPQAGEQLDAWVRQAQHILGRYESSLLALIIGDKGSYLYAAFGAPTAHEDDAPRAVKAALELRDAANNTPGLAPVQIGLARGVLRTGAYGSVSRRTYGVLGDDVNVAAHLMESAVPGEILVSGRVHTLTREAFAFEAGRPLQIKGKTEVVPIYRLVGAGAQAGAGHHLAIQIVGRQKEQARLQDALEALPRGESTVVIVEGESGIGKSCLVAELQEQASRRGVRCLLGWAEAIEKTTPYYAWRPILAHILEWDALAKEPEARRAAVLLRLETALSSRTLAPLLNAVLPLDLPDNETTQLLQGEGRANKTNDFFSQIVQYYAGSDPLVLILEDAHWMDSASWALTRLVSLDVRPLLLVLVTRPLTAPLPKEYGQLLNSPGLVHLQLGSLSPAEIRQLICARLGIHDLPEPVARLIQERAEGHPFFSEELAYALRDSGIIRVEGNLCRVARDVDWAAVTLPDTVQGVIAGRIDRLSLSQQLVLKVASVIGRVFAFSILWAVYPVEDEKSRLAACLDALDRLDITPLETPPPDLCYMFKHVITQEVAYNLMLFTQRQELHRTVAEWYEQTYADDLAPYYSLLAHHWQQAASPDRALEYLRKAGGQAMKGGVYQEAIGFFDQLLALVPRLSTPPGVLQQAQWTCQLGEAHTGVGQIAAGRVHLSRAAALLGRPLPASASALTLGLLWEMACQFVHRLGLWHPPRQAQPDRAAGLLAACQVYEGLAEIAYMDGDKVLALYCGLRSLNLAEQSGGQALEQQARGYSSMAMGAGVLALHRLGALYVRLANIAAHQADSLEASVWVHLALGVYHFDRGQWGQARAFVEDGRHQAEQAGQVRRWEELLSYLSACHYFQGRFDEAMATAARVVHVAARQGDRQAQGWGLAWQARCAMRRGQLVEALDLARQAEGIFGSLQLRTEHLATLGVVLQILLRRGELDAARRTAEQVAALLRQTTPTWQILIDSYEGLASYCLAQWETQPGPQNARRAQDICKRFAQFARTFDMARPLAWLYEGWCQHLAGRPRLARRWLERGLAAARQYGMPYEEAMGCCLLGQSLPAGDPVRLQYLEQAAALYGRLGAAWDVARVREVGWDWYSANL